MNWQVKIQEVLDWRFQLGSLEFSILGLVHFLFLVFIVFLLAALARRLVRLRILSRTGMSAGLQDATARFVGYFVILIGLGISLQVMHIDIKSLAFLAGALGLGLGFGLQNIISNFVSGLIILIERPIQVGDRIEVGGLEGDVMEINARSTKIRTNNSITIIVPNSEFISSRVINWSHDDPKIRVPIPVGVACNSDPRLVEKALMEVASEIPDIMKEPPPGVRFMAFGQSSLNFELRVWTETMVRRKYRLISDVNFRIFEKFQKYGIEIPNPQLDIYVKKLPRQPPSDASLEHDVIGHLRKNRLFDCLNDEDIAQLAEKGRIRKYYPRQEIIRQGEEGDSLFIILKGVAEVRAGKEDSDTPRHLCTLGQGDFFGEMSMLTGEKRSATVIAEAESDIFELRKEALQPILQSNPCLAEEISKSLVRRESASSSKLESLASLPQVRDGEHVASKILTRIKSFFKL